MPRLDRLLAKNLGESRSAIAQRLRRGQVCDLNQQVLGQGNLQIPNLPHQILVEGRPVLLRDRVAILQHKPLGCVTARKDPQHPTAYALLGEAPLFSDLLPVGRLDKQTSGLLLWTTQGPEVHALTHPRKGIPRSYHVALHRPFDPLPPDLRLKDGHQPRIEALKVLDPGQVHPALERNAQARVYATITLTGGAYHEVRRIFAALSSHVLELCRVSHGPFTLPPKLAPGAFTVLDDATWLSQFEPVSSPRD